MKTETKIKTEIEGLILVYLDRKTDDYEEIDVGTEEEYAKKLKCSVELVETLVTLVGSIIETTREDLKTLWERIDEIEKRL